MSRWPELGIITKNPLKKDGKVVKDSNGNTVYVLGFKLDEKVTVLYDGEPVALNEFRSGMLRTPVEEVESLIKNGQIAEDEVEARREKAKEIYSWLRYKVVLPPPRD